MIAAAQGTLLLHSSTVIACIAAVIFGGLLVSIGRRIMERRGVTSARCEADALLQQARLDAEELRCAAAVAAQAEAARLCAREEDEIVHARREMEAQAAARAAELTRREERLQQREERQEESLQAVQDRLCQIQTREGELERAERQLLGQARDQEERLERLAGLSAVEAKAMVLRTAQEQTRREALARVRDIERQALEEADQRARRIVTMAIQRLASEQTADSSVTVVHLSNNEMKGRLIGREGRNIRAFEGTTGVNLLIDDTPDVVVLSCFDPVRREIARITLERLLSDGRVQPARIEETFERARDTLDEELLRAAEDACVRVGVTDLHPTLMKLLGRLKVRTSYGQNVLAHVMETAQLAALMAGELGADAAVAKRGAFLHDIGKALTHEVEGTHALIGGDVARRCGESPAVVHAIEAHHGEVEPTTIAALLCQAADAVSASRPGARREPPDGSVGRLERLESVAASYPGVEKVYAMQAGREVRVLVRPEEVDDLGAQVLAREIAKQIEHELQYPGQVRVTVVREIRSVEYAK